MPTKKTDTAAKGVMNDSAVPKRRRVTVRSAGAGGILAAAKRTARRKVAMAEPLGPTRDEIAVRAYYLSEERLRRGVGGSSEGDWFEAEQTLRRERAV